jgi:hypothetical protein
MKFDYKELFYKRDIPILSLIIIYHFYKEKLQEITINN